MTSSRLESYDDLQQALGRIPQYKIKEEKVENGRTEGEEGKRRWKMGGQRMRKEDRGDGRTEREGGQRRRKDREEGGKVEKVEDGRTEKEP